MSTSKALEVLVLGPVDEVLAPLGPAAALSEYAFTEAVAGSRLTVQPGPIGGPVAVLEAIFTWFHRPKHS